MIETHATTILAVKKDGQVAMAGDGQVTLGQSMIMKHTARKVRRLYDGKIVAGFAGATADAFTLATLHSMQQVRPGQNLAGTRVVPLLIEESKIVALEQLVSRPVVEVLPLQKFKVGIVTTGSEVYTGRIKDAFGPVLRDKFARLECTVMDQVFTSDEVEMTSSAISGFIRQGADMVVVTGGMSVDPDDKTPASIRAAGAQVVSYGAPVYPGAMFLLGYVPTERGRVPVLGLPGCVMYYKASIFELVVPRLLAGLEVTAEDIAGMGHGGFCSGCGECRYPICPFGK